MWLFDQLKYVYFYLYRFCIFNSFLCKRLYVLTFMRMNNLFFSTKTKGLYIITLLVVVDNLFIGADSFFGKRSIYKTLFFFLQKTFI